MSIDPGTLPATSAAEHGSRRITPQGAVAAVSVVIPTRNRAELTCRAVASALDQTLPPAEIVVAMDGSTDDTEAVVTRRFGPRVRVVSQEWRGPAATRNLGIRAARHDIIAFLDSDDVWVPEKLEIQLPTLIDPGVVLSFSDYWPRDKGGTTRFSSVDLPYRDVTRLAQPLRTLTRRRGSGIHVTGSLCRRSALHRIGLFDEDMLFCEDTQVFYRLGLLGPFVVIPKPLFIRGLHSPDPITRHGDSDYERGHTQGALRLFKDLLPHCARQPADVRRNLRRLQGHFLSKQARLMAADGHFASSRHHAIRALKTTRRGRSALRALACALSPRLVQHVRGRS